MLLLAVLLRIYSAILGESTNPSAMRPVSRAGAVVLVRKWLRQELENQFGREARIYTTVSADRYLCSVLEQWGVSEAFRGASTFEIRVDVVGIAQGRKGQPLLFLVEVKAGPINLAALAQLLGYCRIVRPEAAWLLSPKGWAPSLARLVRDFGRTDLLEFAPGRQIIIARWNEVSSEVRPGDTL